jgi:1-acyl-sn-glycerol-3-phosphate acyltransferase
VLAIAAFIAGLPYFVRQMFFVLLSPRYSFRIVGMENVPREGPAMLAINHVTWIDGFLMAAIVPRRAKALVNASYLTQPLLRWIAKRAGIIPVPSAGPKAQRAAIQETRAALDRGEMVGLFPEAQMSRNGLTGAFYRGIEVMLADHPQVPVIPVFLDNVWCSIFSFSGGRFFRKWPRGLRRAVNIAFGPPVRAPVTAFSIRQAVIEAGVDAYALRPTNPPPIPLETVDPSLPSVDHPDFGKLTVSTADYDWAGVRQTGHKPGTVGQAAPGVALRVVDDNGTVLGPDVVGCLQAKVAHRAGWHDIGKRGSIDRDGFVSLVASEVA